MCRTPARRRRAAWPPGRPIRRTGRRRRQRTRRLLDRAANARSALPRTDVARVHEAGKTLPNALARSRAVDFCRYYASRLREPGFDTDGTRSASLPASARELPLAISSASERGARRRQRCRCQAGGADAADCRRAVRLLYEAGVRVPPCSSHRRRPRGALLAADARVRPAVHRSTEVRADRPATRGAQSRRGDRAGCRDRRITRWCRFERASEQVVTTCSLAFDSAGQRCSALRVLSCRGSRRPRADDAQRRAAPARGRDRRSSPPTSAGDRRRCARPPRSACRAHARRSSCRVPAAAAGRRAGHFVAPTVIEIDRCANRREVRPVLHVLRYRAPDSAR